MKKPRPCPKGRGTTAPRGSTLIFAAAGPHSLQPDNGASRRALIRKSGFRRTLRGGFRLRGIYAASTCAALSARSDADGFPVIAYEGMIPPKHGVVKTGGGRYFMRRMRRCGSSGAYDKTAATGRRGEGSAGSGEEYDMLQERRRKGRRHTEEETIGILRRERAGILALATMAIPGLDICRWKAFSLLRPNRPHDGCGGASPQKAALCFRGVIAFVSMA